MSLKIICGCMFSGKTTELININNKLSSIGKKVLNIKSSLDNRYFLDNISNHNMLKIECITLNKLKDVPSNFYKDNDYIIIDECQFFEDLYEFVIKAIDKDNKNVILIGLNGDSNRNNFGELYKLYPHADDIKLLKAFCSMCNNGIEAIYSKKISDNESIIDIGEKDKYIPVCRKCYNNEDEDDEYFLYNYF